MHCIPFLFQILYGMSNTALYGLIGFPLGHSFSPGYFNTKFAYEHIDAEYKAFPVATAIEIKALIQQNPGLKGLNVTIPYKGEVMALLDECDVEAAIIGAVNCISIRNGRTKGYNTDTIGFEQSLRPLLKEHINKALILGTGGAAKAIKFTLNKMGIECLSVSRTRKDGAFLYTELTEDIVKEYKLIVNTTPLGMYPCTESYPEIPYHAISGQHLLYDLIYNPNTTRFLQKGILQGAATKNGLEMLELQAEASWAIWNS